MVLSLSPDAIRNENSILLVPDGCSRDKTYLNDTLRSETADPARQAEFAVERVF